MARKQRGKWFLRFMVLRTFGRMILGVGSKARYDQAERNWIKLGQHIRQLRRLRQMVIALMHLEEPVGVEEIEPFLARLNELLHDTFALEDIPALCEESRTMLFPFEAFYLKNMGEPFVGGPRKYKVAA